MLGSLLLLRSASPTGIHPLGRREWLCDLLPCRVTGSRFGLRAGTPRNGLICTAWLCPLFLGELVHLLPCRLGQDQAAAVKIHPLLWFNLCPLPPPAAPHSKQLCFGGSAAPWPSVEARGKRAHFELPVALRLSPPGPGACPATTESPLCSFAQGQGCSLPDRRTLGGTGRSWASPGGSALSQIHAKARELPLHPQG